MSADDELCGVHVYWWDGEYDGDCELRKGHLEPFHYDGVSYYDDDNNNRDHEQGNLDKLIAQLVNSKLLALKEGLPKKVNVEDEYYLGRLRVKREPANMKADGWNTAIDNITALIDGVIGENHGDSK